MKDRISGDFCELLEDEIEKITKKGDISPAEMDNAYKAIKSVYYLTVMKEMQDAKEQGYSQRGGQGYSGGYSYEGSYGNYNDGSYNSYNDASYGRRGRDGDSDGRYSENSNSRGHGSYNSNGSYDGNYSRHNEKEKLMRNIEDMKRKLETMN